MLYSQSSKATPEEDERLVSFVIENRDHLGTLTRDVDEVYIKRKRIVDSLCTLSTPLIPREAWDRVTSYTLTLPGYMGKPQSKTG